MSQQLPDSPGTFGAGGIGNENLDNTVSGNGPGRGSVGVVGIIGLIAYLVIFTVLLIYALVKVWPPSLDKGTPEEVAAANASQSPTPAATPNGSPSPVQALPAASASASTSPSPSPNSPTIASTASPSPKASASPAASPSKPVPIEIFGIHLKLWDEQRLLLLVLLAGALGSILHDLRSVYWYVGNRNLVRSWMAMFIVLPFAGATLALIFYLVVRGGFFSPQSSFEQTSPFGFAAFAALIGMFSPQAVLKLKEVAETLLTKPGSGADPQPQAAEPPPSAPSTSAPPPTGGTA